MKHIEANHDISDVTIFELSSDELDHVSGGVSSDTSYAVSVGAAVGFVGLAIATAPLTGAAILAGASIAASSIAISYALE
ncbi:hypothetical protein [Halomonas binhaiensis]|uniref:Bacteriocin n=1 Tax=Halomonas binhaiensis TaxID=2562282 RepID=A0A5C1NJF9_9GAMM|nr:hypothetical protein [Halomonas binhaiensis]QEM82245.1 hypothetical protein E4T21_12335 [Halomonas binhaiensis]